ncbi:MAG: hypothetical protein HY791_30325 [Deltaproteobacteria bacterium]|nr:hypothetical protein [Deltaproteobacteria bacterium]
MNRIVRTLLFAALVATTLLASGCMSRQLVGFTDHPAKKMLLLETMDHYNYVFVQSLQHVFWTCEDKGTSLTCKLACGKGTDLQCPTGSAFWSGSVGYAGTNVR